MIKKMKMGASGFWVIVMTLGMLACLGGVAYTFFAIQQEAGQESEYRLAADKLRLLSQQSCSCLAAAPALRRRRQRRVRRGDIEEGVALSARTLLR